ncbi:MAG TPA: PD-(D/E)XK nuclease family protein [Steroidobacteraceae bacterium]
MAAGHTILAPNTELAAALFDALEREQLQAGSHVWATPRVRDFGSWLRELHGQRQLANADSPRVLSDVEERELWRAIVDSTQLARDFLDAGGAALAARRARRVLREFDIPLDALALEFSDEVQAFLAWNQAFEQRCRDLKCISADSLLGSVAPVGPISWIESPIWRPAARRWLTGRGQMLPPRAGAAASFALIKAASPAAELAAIAQWAKTNLDAREDFRAWVCIPDLNRRRAQIIDAMDAALAPQRFGLQGEMAAAPYAVAGGTPLSDYAPVRAALNTLAASVGPLPYLEFGALLRAPELQGSDADASAASLLDVALRSRATSDADLSTWLDLAERMAQEEELGAVAALRRLRAARAALLELHGVQRFSSWVSVWNGALQAGPWSLRDRWTSVEYQAAQRFRELLAALATADTFFGAHTRESAQRILRRAAQDTAFQPQTGVPAVWVSGQLIDPWLHYPGLWVSGGGEEQWPPPIVPVPLLPIRLQREYGIISASAESQLALAGELQRRWQSRADDFIFSHADPSDGSVSVPSTVLTTLSSTLSAVPAAAAPQPHWRAACAAVTDLETLVDELAPPFSTQERTRGVATLRAQSRCAFRGFAETRLAAQRLDTPVPGFNARERGQLAHHALEHVWSKLIDSSALQALSSEAQATLLEQAASRAVSIVCKIRDPGPRWRRRERVRLQNLLQIWLDVERRRAPFTVEVLERSVQEARFAGLEFRVRIDRVDRLADGARVLIDYKTGSATTDWRGDRPENPQLPIYALLLPEALVGVAYAQVKVGDSRFVAEVARRDVFKPGKASTLEQQASFEDLIRVWSRRIETIAGAFAAGHAEVAPTLKACKSCDLHGLCRIPAALEPEMDP